MTSYQPSSESIFWSSRYSKGLAPRVAWPRGYHCGFSGGQKMDLFNLISAPNPAKVKIGTRPRAAHKVQLLTAMVNRVIHMDTTGASGSSGTPSAVEKSPLDFVDEDLPPPNTEGVGTEEQVHDELSREIPHVGHATTAEVMLETGMEEEVATMGPGNGYSTKRQKTQQKGQNRAQNWKERKKSKSNRSRNRRKLIGPTRPILLGQVGPISHQD
ncbi:hypothetical protein Tco_0829671 [Tanacetum coccineum]